ncbi:MAG: DNA methyltransferase [Verrucomicrobiae bacterium]
MESVCDTASFIARWTGSGAAERANYQLFLSELSDVLGVPRPAPTRPDDADNAYVFERSVTFHHPDGSTSTGRIDLYKRGCYVLEAKQGVEKREAAEALAAATKAKAKAAKKGTAQRGSAAWDEAMLKARGQAEQYARALPASEGRPPLLVVVDVGHSIELYSEFTRTGGTYVPFPDPQSHRILLARLGDADVRETLRLAWTDPQALDPARRSARVTRDIAQSLGRLAASLEKSGHSAETVAAFLMRALFTMFAEDVELLPKDSFVKLLKSLHGHTDQFVPMIEELWGRMKTGGFSTVLREKVRHFNGGLFEHATALPLTDDQFELLIEASRADWRDVEPAIFGTLLERALNPIERHKLGAHYTPRAYVERLVMPTVVEPLRAEWDAAKAAAVTLDRQGKTNDAVAEVQRFHRRLCEVRVLDPACGSGNFLYVTLEHLKRLEGEVFNALDRLGHEQAALEMTGFTVDPHQLLGLEVNPRAAAIAELVLWIGYLQWHFRTRGHVDPPEPIIKSFHNIECRDAVLAYDRTEPVLDEQGEPVTRWDGRTMKKHPVTGEDVPDEAARVPLRSYINPRPAEWPQADFIVGNPPFIGSKRMRECLGDAYVDAIQEAWSAVPQSTDFVMRWWHHAACLLAKGKVRRFGFITTNSFGQTYVKRAVEPHLEGENPISIVYAIPNHPWVDSADGAAVRISMTVADKGMKDGVLQQVISEQSGDGEGVLVELDKAQGKITASLRTGADLNLAVELSANASLCAVGMKTIGAAFQVNRECALRLGLETVPGIEKHIRPYLNGRDLLHESRGIYIVDFFGVPLQDVMSRFPAAYQHLFLKAKPEREQNRNAQFAKLWWVIGHPRQAFREFTRGLQRYIATVETSKHRIVTFLPSVTTPDSTLVTFGFDDAYALGVLSSRIHVVWALATGGRLGVGNDPRYNKTRCFETFPFPTATEAQQTHIRDLAEVLDAHRKRQQGLHLKLTLTDCYNVLEKLRSGTVLNAKEQLTHEQGLVTVLRQLHDDLDAAVAEAYGLPPTASDEAILTHLCARNAQRAAEERAGQIRYLRPAFQNPASTATQPPLATPDAALVPKSTTPVPQSKIPWPKTLAEQAQSVRSALADLIAPASAETIAASFKNANSDRIAELLDTLTSLGHARALPGGTFIAT